MNEITYRILDPNGSEQTGVVMRDKVAGYDKLKRFVEPILQKTRAEARLKHVAVLYENKRASMFVDDEGVAHGQPINKQATAIYWASSRARGESPDNTWPRIHGVAIVFNANLWS